MATHEANADGDAQHPPGGSRRGCLHVVVASSSSVYGANPALPKARGHGVPMPMSPYAVSKLATEQYAMAFARVL